MAASSHDSYHSQPYNPAQPPSEINQPPHAAAAHMTTAWMRRLDALNSATQWIVTLITFCVVTYYHNLQVMWVSIGSVLAMMLCKLLKRVINGQRPPNARKKDPGMPSSHANALQFLSSSAASALLMAPTQSQWHSGIALLVVSIGVFLTALRWVFGYHTVAQVMVGAVLGGCCGVAWTWLGWRFVVPMAAENMALCCVIYAAAFVAAGGYVVKVASKRLKPFGMKKFGKTS